MASRMRARLRLNYARLSIQYIGGENLVMHRGRALSLRLVYGNRRHRISAECGCAEDDEILEQSSGPGCERCWTLCVLSLNYSTSPKRSKVKNGLQAGWYPDVYMNITPTPNSCSVKHLTWFLTSPGLLGYWVPDVYVIFPMATQKLHSKYTFGFKMINQIFEIKFFYMSIHIGKV